MSKKAFKVKKAMNLEPLSSPPLDEKGDVGFSSANDTLQYHDGTTVKEVADTSSTQTITNKVIDADSNTISNIEDADIKTGAAIARAKLANGTASHVLINDGSGVLSSEATLAKSRGGAGADMTNVTFPSTGTLTTNDGTQTLTNKTINANNNTISGITNIMIDPTATITFDKMVGLTPNRVPQINGSGVIAASSTTTTELGYVSGVTSAIQTQLNGKVSNTLTTTTGDMIYASGANTPARLAIGSSNQVLTVSGGLPTWQTPTANPVTTKGDIATYSTVPTRLPVGSNGQYLVADSTQSTGLLWTSPVNAFITASTSQTLTTGVSTKVNFDTVIYDTDSAFNTTTKSYTIPTGKGGKYRFSGTLMLKATTGTYECTSSFNKNGSIIRTHYGSGKSGTANVANSWTFEYTENLAAGDVVYIQIWQASGGNLDTWGDNLLSGVASLYIDKIG